MYMYLYTGTSYKYYVHMYICTWYEVHSTYVHTSYLVVRVLRVRVCRNYSMYYVYVLVHIYLYEVTANSVLVRGIVIYVIVPRTSPSPESLFFYEYVVLVPRTMRDVQ